MIYSGECGSMGCNLTNTNVNYKTYGEELWVDICVNLKTDSR